jgi:hypothetical protein
METTKKEAVKEEIGENSVHAVTKTGGTEGKGKA